MPAIFEQTLTVPEAAIDVHGHVNNIEYLRWMQEVAVGHSDARGWTLEKYLELGMTWFARSHRIDYLGQAYAGEQIRVRTWVANMRKCRSLRRYLFEKVSDGAILARAETDWVFINLENDRPVPVHPSVTRAFTLVEEGEAP